VASEVRTGVPGGVSYFLRPSDIIWRQIERGGRGGGRETENDQKREKVQREQSDLPVGSLSSDLVEGLLFGVNEFRKSEGSINL
jgi:hypothetical protein